MKDTKAVVEAIKQRVKLGELLKQRHAISYTMPEEQLHCPFHGADRKKSARYYRETDSAYCWVCKESWDIVSFTMRAEQINFAQAISKLVKDHKVDISKLPDMLEAVQRKHVEKQVVKVDKRLLYLEKLTQAITALRDELDFEKYKRVVYAYMLLKHATTAEKFEGSATKLKDAILKSIGAGHEQ